MIYPLGRFRSKRVLLLFTATFLVVSIWSYRQATIADQQQNSTYATDFPLSWRYLQMSNGTGGAWYIPAAWLVSEDRQKQQPQTILEAAQLASALASKDISRQMDLSSIPLIVHQTWATTKVESWSQRILVCVERWLAYCITADDDTKGEALRPMAYFFWDDEGVLEFMQQYEPAFVDAFLHFFSPVERADIFRILVCKWFGGIYGDVDTEPLQPPHQWVHSDDIVEWEDPQTGNRFGNEKKGQDDGQSVSLLVGLEADVDSESDAFWRMGYTYPVQLTQWALASAAQHPVLLHFMHQLQEKVDVVWKEPRDNDDIYVTDPLTWTGPVAITVSVRSWLEAHVTGFRWNAVSGLHDGGRAKLVEDVLVLPITGFSPGRGTYGNMGSKPVSDPDARLFHHAYGSWKKFYLKVELGKFCRTVFGMCRDWSHVPT